MHLCWDLFCMLSHTSLKPCKPCSEPTWELSKPGDNQVALVLSLHPWRHWCWNCISSSSLWAPWPFFKYPTYSFYSINLNKFKICDLVSCFFCVSLPCFCQPEPPLPVAPHMLFPFCSASSPAPFQQPLYFHSQSFSCASSHDSSSARNTFQPRCPLLSGSYHFSLCNFPFLGEAFLCSYLVLEPHLGPPYCPHMVQWKARNKLTKGSLLWDEQLGHISKHEKLNQRSMASFIHVIHSFHSVIYSSMYLLRSCYASESVVGKFFWVYIIMFMCGL